MSTDLHTLSGAYALNALSAEEAEQFRKHLEACTVCSEEVRELQQAAATMGADETVPPPAYLKARVLSAVNRTPQLPPRNAGNVIQVAPHRWGRRFLLAAAAVVVIVAGAFGVSQVGQDTEQQDLLAANVARVFEAQDAQAATMKTEVEGRSGQVSVAASPKLNQMAVDTHELPALDEQHVYWLWAVHDGRMDSVGPVEREKGAAMDMPEPDTEVAITIEPIGGSAEPTTDPIMRVNPSEI